MADSLVMLAHKIKDQDVTGWLCSEKLDGVRGYWTGSELLTRTGKPLYAPDWFLAALPRGIELDGELWGGRNTFQEICGIVRRHQGGEAWRKVAYVAFDAPCIRDGFRGRLRELEEIVASVRAAHVMALPHEIIASMEDLKARLAGIEAKGGEGLMVREPTSEYVRKRSHHLLKIKSFHDLEAVVVGHEPGKGKHKGRLGALVCELPSGTRFKIGTGFTDHQRENPAPLGAIVTVGFFEQTKDGKPRFPTFIGLRGDS